MMERGLGNLQGEITTVKSCHALVIISERRITLEDETRFSQNAMKMKESGKTSGQ